MVALKFTYYYYNSFQCRITTKQTFDYKQSQLSH